MLALQGRADGRDRPQRWLPLRLATERTRMNGKPNRCLG